MQKWVLFEVQAIFSLIVILQKKKKKFLTL